MSRYRRANVKAGTYFFTVVTYRRQTFLCNNNVRAALREGIQQTRTQYPFTIDAWVLLPDHLHCIWTLPKDDANFGLRWAIIKRHVTKVCGLHYLRKDLMTASKRRRNESTIWQRRFWEHQIRNDEDYRSHMDYIHYNPVKHGLASCANDWSYSTFHRYVKLGVYPEHWGCGDMSLPGAGFGE